MVASITAFTRLNIAVLAPMPRASVATASAVEPGLFPSIRNPKRMSCQRVCTGPPQETHNFHRWKESNRNQNLLAARPPTADAPLLQPDAVESIPGRHVGQNHLVAHFQPINDFDGVDATPPQLHVYARGLRAVLC